MNSNPTKSNRGCSSYELFVSRSPNFYKIKIFDCFCFICCNYIQNHKLEAQFSLGIYLGLNDASKEYMVYSLTIKKIQITHDVFFDKT